MIDTTYWVDGVALDDPEQRWVLAADNPLTAIPGARLASVTSPGLHGVLHPYGEPYEAVEHGLRIAVTSNDKWGEDGGWEQLIANLNFLQGLFARRTGPLELTRLQGGIKASKEARLSASARPEMLDARTAILTVSLTADPFWLETAERAIALPALNSTPTAWTFTELAGSSAPVTHIRFEVDWNVKSFVARDLTSGSEVRYLRPQASDVGGVTEVRPWEWRAKFTRKSDGAWEWVDNLVATYPHSFELAPALDAQTGQFVYRAELSATRAVEYNLTARAYARRAFL